MLRLEYVKYTGRKERLTIQEFQQLLEGRQIDQAPSNKKKERKSKSKSKYHAVATEFDKLKFDSQTEALRYAELRDLEKRGIIRDLELQKKFELIPRQLDKRGKVVERACNYFADFCYTRCDGTYVVEDVKSKPTQTSTYIIKRKLMLYIYGIKITEVFVEGKN